jgi:PKD repeat protein
MITVNPRPRAIISNGGTICSDESIALTISGLHAVSNSSGLRSVKIEMNGGGLLCGAETFDQTFSAAGATVTHTVNPAAGTATRYQITKITDNTTGCVSTTTPEITGFADVYKRVALTAPTAWANKPADDLCENTSYLWKAPSPLPTVTLTSCNSPAASPQTVEYKWTSSTGWGVNTNGSSPDYTLANSQFAAFPNGTAQKMMVAYRYTIAANRSSKTGEARYCPTSTLDHNVTVIPTPSATVNSSTQTICNTADASVTVNLRGVANSPWTFTWRLKKGIWVSPTSFTFTTPVGGVSTGTYTATVNIPNSAFAAIPKAGSYIFELVSVTQARGNCSGSVANTATINVRDVPTASLSGDNSLAHICENTSYTITPPNFILTGYTGGSYTVTVHSDRPGSTDLTFNNIPLGSSLTIPANMIKPGTATTTITVNAVKQTVSGVECAGTYSGSFLIYTDKGPDAGPDQSTCSAVTLTLAAVAQLGNTWVQVDKNPTAATWPFLSSTTAENATLTKTSPGVFRYAWMNTAGCADTVTVTFAEDANQAVIDKTKHSVCGPTFQLKGQTSVGALKVWETGTWALFSAPGGGMVTSPISCGVETGLSYTSIPGLNTTIVSPCTSPCVGIASPISTASDPTITVNKPGLYGFLWEVKTSCSFTVDTIFIQFNQIPDTKVVPSTLELCEGDSSLVNFRDTDASFESGVVYEWTYSGISGVHTSIAGVGGSNVYILAPKNGSSISSDVMYTITVKGKKDGCEDGKTLSLRAKPKPHVNPIPDQELCPWQSMTLDINPALTNMTGGIDYEWAGTPGPHPNSGITDGTVHLAIAPYPHLLVAGQNNTGSDQTGKIAIMATVRGCKSDSLKINVRVKPQPVITFDPLAGNKEYCSLTNLEQSDLTQFYTNVSGASVDWTYSGPIVGLSGINQSAIPVASTLPQRYTVTPFTTTDNLSGVNMTGTVTVHAISEGCDTTRFFTIAVKPRPVITVSPATQEKCALPTTATPSAANKFSDITPVPAYTYTPNYKFWVRDATFHNNVGGVNLGVDASGTAANMTDIWVPTSADGIDSVMRVVIYPMLSGCEGDSVEVRYTAKPLPVVNPVDDQYVCPREYFEDVSFTTNMTGNISNIRWTFTGPDDVGKTGTGVGPLTSFAAVDNTTGDDIKSNVSVVATSNFGCTSDPATTFSYKVFPEPVITNPLAASPDRFCYDPALTVTFAKFTTNIVKTGATADYTWDISTADIGLVPTSGSGSSISNYKIPDFTPAKNLTGGNIIGTINMNATTNDLSQTGKYCRTSTPKTIQLTLLTAPKMIPISSQAVCPEFVINNITFATNLGGVTEGDFRWKLTELGLPISQTTGSYTQLPAGLVQTGYLPAFMTTSNTPPPAIEGNFEVWARIDMGSGLYCWGDTTRFTVSVKRKPDVKLPEWAPGEPKDTLFYCPQESTQIYPFGSSDLGSVSFQWSYTGETGLALSGNQTGSAVPSFIATNNGDNGKHTIKSDFIVQAQLNGCFSDTARFTYIVGPVPQINPPKDTTVCAGDPVFPKTFVPSSDTIPDYTYDYSWAMTGSFPELNDWILVPPGPSGSPYPNMGNGHLPPFVGDTLHNYPPPTGNALWGTVPKNIEFQVQPQYRFRTGTKWDKTCSNPNKTVIHYTINPLPITKLMPPESKCVQDGEAKMFQVEPSDAVGSVYTWGLEDLAHAVIPKPVQPPPPAAPVFPPAPNAGAPLIQELNQRFEVYQFPNPATDWSGYVTVKEKNVFGCYSPLKEMAVSVITAPRVFAGNDTTVCSGETFTVHGKLLSPVPNPGIDDPMTPWGKMTYEWFPSTSLVQGTYYDTDGILAERTLEPVVKPYASINLTLRALMEGCWSKRDTIKIKVGRTPSMPFIADQTYCESVDEYNLSFSSSSLDSITDVVRWFRGIRDVSGKWFTDSATPYDTLVVLPGANDLLTVDMKSTTEPNRLPPSLTFVGGNEEASVQYGVYVTSTDNCMSDTALTTLRIRKIPDSPASDLTEYCRNNQTSFMLETIGSNIRWYTDTIMPPNPYIPGLAIFTGNNFSATITGPAVSVTGVDTAFYITQSAPNGCVSLYAEKKLKVHPDPLIHFAMPDTAGCADFDTYIDNLVADPTVDYIINWGDSQTDTLIGARMYHTYVNNTAYTSTSQLRFDAISKINKDLNGTFCNVHKNKQIVVFPKVDADFTASTLSICDQSEVDPSAQLPITFYAQATNASTFDWDMGDGTTSTLRGVSHIFNSALPIPDKYRLLDSALVTLKAGTGPNIFNFTTYNACEVTVSKWVRILPVPKSEFTVTDLDGNLNPTWVCSPANLTFDNLNWNAGTPPNNGKNGAVLYYWDMDGSSNTGIDTVYRFNNSSFQTRASTISLMVTELKYGCSASSQYTVQVMPRLTARFDPDITEGCSPTSVNFYSDSPGAKIYDWFWDSPSQPLPTDVADAAGQNVAHQFDNTGRQEQLYHVWLRTQVGTTMGQCFMYADTVISIYPVPPAAFEVSPSDLVYPNTSVLITNTLSPSERIGLYFEWNILKQNQTTPSLINASPDPGSYPVNDWGTFDIIQHVSTIDGKCPTELRRTIRIVPPKPIASFDAVPPACSPYEVHFQNTSMNANSYLWEFGDGQGNKSLSSVENPIHTYADPGHYIVTLVAFGDADLPDTTKRVILVNPVPEAIFSVSPQYMWVNQIAYTFNHTSNVTPAGEVYGIWYKWDMGDGSDIDTMLNVAHAYTKPGKYDVTLTVGTYGEPQCISTRTIKEAVEVVNAGDVLLPNAFKPDATGEPSDVIPNEQSYRNYLFFPPVMQPTREYHLAVYNRWGQLIYQTNDPTRGWNGYFKGQMCAEGVYVYRIWGTFENGESFQKRGDILLMR